MLVTPFPVTVVEMMALDSGDGDGGVGRAEVGMMWGGVDNFSSELIILR